MQPMLHVLNGDATRLKLERSGVPGKFTVWADALHEGPVPAGVELAELRALRARYFARALGEPEARVLAVATGWDEALGRYADFEEVVFWFEHDLFDQLILIRHLAWLSTIERSTTRFSLICIGSFPGVATFTGLGQLAPEQLATLLPQRAAISEAQIALGQAAWKRFREPKPQPFAELLDADTSALPFLAGAIRRHLEDYPSVSNGLSRSERQILTAVATGAERFGVMFAACQRVEERPYMGDTTFRSIVLALANASQPLLATGPDGAFVITTVGRNVLAGRTDHVTLNGIDRWMGGTHLTTDTLWRAEALFGSLR